MSSPACDFFLQVYKRRVPNQRSEDQQLVAFALDKRLLAELDRAARSEGRDRSTYIRLALVDDLRRRGNTEVDDSMAHAPSRHKTVYPAPRGGSYILNETSSGPSRPKTVEEAAAAEEALAEELAKKPGAPAPIYRAARRARRK